LAPSEIKPHFYIYPAYSLVTILTEHQNLKIKLFSLLADTDKGYKWLTVETTHLSVYNLHKFLSGQRFNINLNPVLLKEISGAKRLTVEATQTWQQPTAKNMTQ
jgi:hypothetical protein